MCECLCIGAAHIDIKMIGNEQIIMGTSNPVSSYCTHGGAVRNVCENLAHLGVKTSLVSRVGADSEGKDVVFHLNEVGVNTKGITLSDNYPTAKYFSVINSTGDMIVACADMDIYDEITPSVISSVLSDYLEIPLWVADMNFSPAVISTIKECAHHQKVWLLSVSIPKIMQYRQDLSSLNGIYGISLNQKELSAFVDHPCNTIQEIDEGCLFLNHHGVKHILVTMGSDGVYSSDKKKHYPVLEDSKLYDTTGAGDAFLAGFLHGQMMELSTSECVEKGMEIAQNTLSSPKSVATL